MTAHRNLVVVQSNTLGSAPHRLSTDIADDASWSSTVTVDNVAKPLTPSSPCLAASSNGKPKKSVQFCQSRDIFHENTIYCEEDACEFWHTAEDYRHFKSSTMFMAKEIARSERTNKAPFSFQRVLMRTYEVCCNQEHEVANGNTLLSRDEKKRLSRWSAMAVTRLGLERWACKAINRDKSYRRHEIVDAVLEAQDNNMQIEGDQNDEALDNIRVASERISRTSRLFARCLAEAQSDRGTL